MVALSKAIWLKIQASVSLCTSHASFIEIFGAVGLKRPFGTKKPHNDKRSPNSNKNNSINVNACQKGRHCEGFYEEYRIRRQTLYRFHLSVEISTALGIRRTPYVNPFTTGPRLAVI